MFILAIAEWRRGEGLTTSLPWVRAPEIVILFWISGTDSATNRESITVLQALCQLGCGYIAAREWLRSGYCRSS